MSGAVVSVITIFLDEIEFLGEAIDSVREQDFTSWELLLCDDGSTDGSHELALRHAAEDDRIRVLTHPDRENRGMSAARNLGLCHARGRYVAFLDGDDRWPTDKLRTQVAALDARPAVALAAGASTYWRSWSTGDPSDDVVVPVGAPAGAVVEPPDLTTMLYPLGTGAAPCLCDLMVRRDVVEAVGGFEEQFRGLYEDQAFLLKVYLRHSVYIAEGSPSWYRQHPTRAWRPPPPTVATTPYGGPSSTGWASTSTNTTSMILRSVWRSAPSGVTSRSPAPRRRKTAWRGCVADSSRSWVGIVVGVAVDGGRSGRAWPGGPATPSVCVVAGQCSRGSSALPLIGSLWGLDRFTVPSILGSYKSNADVLRQTAEEIASLAQELKADDPMLARALAFWDGTLDGGGSTVPKAALAGAGRWAFVDAVSTDELLSRLDRTTELTGGDIDLATEVADRCRDAQPSEPGLRTLRRIQGHGELWEKDHAGRAGLEALAKAAGHGFATEFSHPEWRQLAGSARRHGRGSPIRWEVSGAASGHRP